MGLLDDLFGDEDAEDRVAYLEDALGLLAGMLADVYARTPDQALRDQIEDLFKDLDMRL